MVAHFCSDVQIEFAMHAGNIGAFFMAEIARQHFNPCLLNANEQIPAKIWELLRRNDAFRADVQRLSELDDKERDAYEKTNKYHGAAWNKSLRLVERISACHSFAGIALQWLVPEPLFHCQIATWPLGKKWKSRPLFPIRFLDEGEGTTPDITDEAHWRWWNPNKPDVGGHPMRRGPEVFWTKSRVTRLRSKVNPIREWRRYHWPFTVEHSWHDAPAQFRREFQFIWRRQFDCRPTNPITGDRRDSPTPHETDFFRGWNLFRRFTDANRTQDDLAKYIHFTELARDYRVFAIPKTILTKASADAMGKWLADELKKGSDLYGDLLKGKLLNEGELLGTTPEWQDWLAHNAKQTSSIAKDSHFYRRCRYMDSLVSYSYPIFDIAKLLASPKHRARGKQYVPKGRQK